MKEIATLAWIAVCRLLALSTPAQGNKLDAHGHEWWQHAVFYEIYPRRFARVCH